MISWKTELAGALLVLATLAGVPIWVFAMEAHFTKVEGGGGGEHPRVITLTAVSHGGIWTEEEVVGHNYWRRRPKVARPVVRVGETVVIRLKSADVTHSFSIPALDVGPVVVEGGHVAEVRFTPREPGEYLTQCSTRCGECHEEMLGTIVVLGPGQTIADYQRKVLPARTKCHLE